MISRWYKYSTWLSGNGEYWIMFIPRTGVIYSSEFLTQVWLCVYCSSNEIKCWRWYFLKNFDFPPRVICTRVIVRLSITVDWKYKRTRSKKEPICLYRLFNTKSPQLLCLKLPEGKFITWVEMLYYLGNQNKKKHRKWSYTLFLQN